MLIDDSFVMFQTEFTWNYYVNKERQRVELSKGRVWRDHVDMFIHHAQVPSTFYPSQATSFTAVLTSDISGVGVVAHITLSRQLKSRDSHMLPFRAKMVVHGEKRFQYMVIAFTGIREAWVANFHASKAGVAPHPPYSNTGGETLTSERD